MPRRERPPLDLDLTQPRSAGGVISTTWRVYVAHPLLLITLTALVVIPYEVIVLLIAGDTSAVTNRGGQLTLVILDLVNVLVVVPLISSLQLQALVSLASDEHPRLGTVFRRALPVLLGVIAAEIIAGIGIAIGFFLFVIPGIYLAIRWVVVAQTAAYEQTRWPTTLGRTWSMTRGNFLHILGTLVILWIVLLLISALVLTIVSHASSGVGVTVAIVLNILLQSFAALALAVLYFDLRAREP